ncbi:hypothetical protein [Mucilaginibacter glaciei]|uniref:Uncharacterized protein n=1 Tax=Mucilaginibacter glaciei TaxID=2772109 RepID=A0A926NJL4_9SPHI|nr:hypothetical protein [Mucilaginibacter glaciei]MBD1392436.1 hypothetical protein [Mucilaginibacter glaciei]
MINDVLKQYKVVFTTPLDYALYNKIETVNEWLSQFIDDHYTKSMASRLATNVAAVLHENPLTPLIFFTQSMQCATITSSSTKIYELMDEYLDDNNITPAFVLPTADFKIIVESWSDYVQNSPKGL